MTTRLFVSNLPDDVQENDLRAAFSTYGEITNLDLKSKSSNNDAKEQKKFAFITLSGTNYDIESCIKHFSNENFHGTRLYVTKARESFLERLQREREQSQKKELTKEQSNEIPNTKLAVINLGDKLNPRKRKLVIDKTYQNTHHELVNNKKFEEKKQTEPHFQNGDGIGRTSSIGTEKEKRKFDSEKKRLESMKQKREEFRAKQMIIKTGLTGVDKIPNKKVIFSDSDDEKEPSNSAVKNTDTQKNKLFDDDDSDGEVNFDIKKQFEGKKGQKVLDLQSRYKSDKRFTLDERFMEDDPDDQGQDADKEIDDEIELGQTDEKTKQLNILQDLLGVVLKTSSNKDPDAKKAKPKLGMLRFDPSHPEHAKFLIPKENIQKELTKKGKKKLKDKNDEKNEEGEEPVVAKVEVSKEKFYKVSETLKDAITQPNPFSLRSLFPTKDEATQDTQEQETDIRPLEKHNQQKVKNPLDPGQKNPFVYDSSESENEEDTKAKDKVDLPITESKAVWKENLFFLQKDNRLKEGLAFFNKATESEVHKERRELKSLVKKRIYNKERKNQMFQKKIGGRKKTMKKNFRKKS